MSSMSSRIFILCSLIFYSCTEDSTQLIFNLPPDLPSPLYTINLRNYDSGAHLTLASLNWNGGDGAATLTDLKSGQSNSTTESYYEYTDMYPGEFRDIQVNLTRDGTEYTDTVQIFTRPVFAANNFTMEIEVVKEGNGIWDENESFTDLDSNGVWNDNEPFTDIKINKYKRMIYWTPTYEPKENFTKYSLYRAEKNEVNELLNPQSCTNCVKLGDFDLTDSTFIDSAVQETSGDFSYYYLLETWAETYKRSSYIYNYTDFSKPSKISISSSDVTINREGYIKVSWTPGSSNEYFYQYEIWRSPEEDQTRAYRIAVIPEQTIDHFMDRNAGSGTTFYYSVAVVDINGRRQFSNYVSGWSLP